MDHESFKTMAMYLLFSSTYDLVPVASVIDMKIKENLEKGGSAKNAALWNWTPLQKSLLDADLPRVIMTSHWSTGKTRILFVKALMLAKDGKFVIFILHYSQINEESKDSKDTQKVSENPVKKHNESSKRDEDFSKTKEEPQQTNFADHAPILLYHSLMNEIEKESEKNPQVKANIKLMISKDLKEDVLKKNVFDNGRLAEKGLSLEHLLSFFRTYDL